MPDIIPDGLVEELKALPKRLVNPRARVRRNEQLSFESVDYEVVSLDETQRFGVYKRQNLLDPTDFSTGIRWIRRRSEITLARYNGSSHEHRNALEGDRLNFVCHVHLITERYQAADRKPEGFATFTNAYRDLDGAFRMLQREWHIEDPQRPVATRLSPRNQGSNNLDMFDDDDRS